jgi:hypothetical protein
LLRALTPNVVRRPAVIIPIALALTAAGFAADPHIEIVTDDREFPSPETSVINIPLIGSPRIGYNSEYLIFNSNRGGWKWL